ncbi:hypothetical protein F511_30788 [Dorcoceras hygrometricum]|uniref:Uncharacterized protein n=1 Tax=Dorcoceras hygrometricum TaxID=472368 RepID=A0A2Z7A8U2_9LAMI|nr:hypothetical protein F511_30788 [Dorcoceras hygrometricum]
MSIEFQSYFSKGKSGNISSNELTDCTRSVDAKIVRLLMIWMRCLNGSSRQASNAGARDEKNIAQLLGMEQSWSLEAAQEQERAEQAQLQTKIGADAGAALEQIKDKEQPAC